MVISNKITEKICTISLKGSLNMQHSGKIRSYVIRLINEEVFEALILDLNDVDVMDSTGLAIMILLRKELKEKEIDIALCQPSEAIFLSIRRVGLSKLVPIYDTQADAFASFQHKR